MPKIILVAVAIFVAVVCVKETETAIPPEELKSIVNNYLDVNKFNEFLQKLEKAKTALLSDDPKVSQIVQEANDSQAAACKAECKCDAVCFVHSSICRRFPLYMFFVQKGNAVKTANALTGLVNYYFYAVNVNHKKKTCGAYKPITEAQKSDLIKTFTNLAYLFSIMDDASSGLAAAPKDGTEFIEAVEFLESKVGGYCSKTAAVECKALSAKRSDLCTFLGTEEKKLTQTATNDVVYATLEGIVSHVQAYLIELYTKFFKDKSC